MRYITVTRALLILSVFSFVLAAPVPVQKVREADSDAVDVSRKRAEQGHPYKRAWPDTGSWDKSDPEYLTWTPSHQSPSTSGPSGSGEGVDMPSSSSTVKESPSSPASTGSESPPRPLSTPGATEMPLGQDGALRSVPATEGQPTSSSRVKSVGFKPMTNVIFYDSDLPPDVKLDPTVGTQEASSSGSKSVSWKHTTKVIFPDEKPLPFPPPKKDLPMTKVANAKLTNFVDNFKTLFSLGASKFRPRFQRLVDTGA